MSSLRIAPADVRFACVAALYVLLLALLPLLLSDADFRHAFSEAGPFERLSVMAWLITACVVVVRIRPLGMRAWAFALLFVLFAAREADLHKAFTADSMLKTNYYKQAVAPLGEKLVAAIVAITLIALVLYGGFVIMRFLFWQRGWRSRPGFWLLLGAGLMVAGKGIDRAPAILAEEFGMALLPVAKLYFSAFEEGLELLHPLILAWSVWISQTDRRYLS